MLQGTCDSLDILHRLDCLEAWVSTTNPTANNDSVDTAGIGRRFGVGSTWINQSSHVVFHCVVSTPGAAVWA